MLNSSVDFREHLMKSGPLSVIWYKFFCYVFSFSLISTASICLSLLIYILALISLSKAITVLLVNRLPNSISQCMILVLSMIALRSYWEPNSLIRFRAKFRCMMAWSSFARKFAKMLTPRWPILFLLRFISYTMFFLAKKVHILSTWSSLILECSMSI